MTLKPTSLLVWFAIALICARTAVAAELHPIVEVQSGYVFGAIADGKWIKADEAAKSMTDETTYRVYGMTQALGEAKASGRNRSIVHALRGPILEKSVS